MHLPLGVLTMVMGILIAGWAAGIFAVGFIIYETNEDWHLKDGAWIDIKGFLWGCGINSS